MNHTAANDTLLTPPVDYEIRPLPVANDSRRLMVLVGLAAFVTMSSIYLAVRSSDKPTVPTLAPHAAAMPANGKAPDVQAMVDRLAARLEKEPENGPGWQMLAKSYAALGRFADAAAAYRRAAALLPTDANLLADYADVLAMANAGNFLGEPARLIRNALEIDPRHPKALALAGTEALRRNAIDEALRYWTQALEAVPADSELAISVRNGIAEAEKRRARTVVSGRQ
jgi:cytochrome c-type biogenesis protein CcmH